MIRIGLGIRDKQKLVNEYIKDHNSINKIFCFYYKDFPIKLNTGIDVEYIDYAEIIMYRTFYPLLEKIDNNSLLIFNECMRTNNRSDLTYNCAHHYSNQTGHKIVFEYFPIIDTKNDFMILLDLVDKGKYKGKSFDYLFLQTEDVKVKPRKIKLEIIPVETSEHDRVRYERRKEMLFNNLGNKDPDTIPRNLQLFAGDLKKGAVEPDNLYIARNKRFNLDNVKSYTEVTEKGDYIVIDMHYRRINFNDFLKITQMRKVKYLSTTLSIDNVIINDFAEWKARLDAIYGQANLY